MGSVSDLVIFVKLIQNRHYLITGVFLVRNSANCRGGDAIELSCID
jgi:hypothetical protein